jgi:hypothetical protein
VTGRRVAGLSRVLWLLVALAGAGPSGFAAPVSAQIPEQLAGERYQSLEGVRARIHFAREDSLLAVRLLELVDGQQPLPALPPDAPSGVDVVVTHAPAAFDELTGGAVPEWRAGVALPAANLMVIPAGEGPSVVEGDGRRTLRHEWAHLGLHGHLGELRVPRWFDEGYAQWVSGGFDASEAWRLRVLLALDRAPSMDSLSLRWPSELEQARIAYLLSASAVAYLLEASGERGLAVFFDHWRAEQSFDRALLLTYGVTPGQFEEDWKEHVRDRYGWLVVLGHSSVFWLVLTLVLLLLVAVRRRRNREKLARLRATEPPDDPAYWIEVDRGPVPPHGG